MSAGGDDGGADPEAVLEAMIPFEPYTDERLARELEIQKRKAREFLTRLEREERVVRKEPAGSPPLWVREPTPQECPKCGRAFGITYRHAVLSAARFCPGCGTRL